MSWDLRTIAYHVEFLHPPVAHTPQALQKLHGELFTGEPGGYLNFAVTPGGATLSNPPQAAGQVQATVYLADRVQIREEMVGSTLEEYCARMEHVLGATFRHLPLPVLTGQQVIVRSLVNPRGVRDARTFLAHSVLRLQPAGVAAIGRDANLYGLRLAFPQTSEHTNLLQLRIESYTADPRSVFLESTAMFPVVVNAECVGLAGENVVAVYEFLNERVTAFLEAHEPRESGS